MRRATASRRPAALRALAVASILLAAVLATPAAAIEVGSAASPHSAVGTTAHVAKRAALRVDRAGYAAVTPVDPFHGDHNAIHLAVTAGQTLSVGYLHVDISTLPPHGKLSTLRVSAPVVVGSPIGGAAFTIAKPIIEACVLTAPLPTTLAAVPSYDCAKGSSVGHTTDGGAQWTFPLEPLLHYWLSHRNTGAALVPIASTPVATWGAALGIHDLAATVEQPVPAQPTTRSGPMPRSVSQRDTGGTPSGSVPQPAPSLPTVTAPIPTTVPAPAIASPNSRLAAATTDDHGVLDEWPWVLLGCILIALGAIGSAHRALIAEELQRQIPPIIATIRTHPRAYGVAATAIAWGVVFTGYAVVNNNDESGMPPVYRGVAEPGGLVPTTPDAVPGVAPSPTSGGGRSGRPGETATTSTGPGNDRPRTNPSATEFTGKGHWQTISGTRVFFPANGGVPTADLYRGAADRLGITSKTITLCGHAATTYGPAFDIGAKDLNVYWNWLNDHGGIFGRKVVMSYQNDNYEPGQAVQAAQKCKDTNPFFLIGGIGFDQIPAVRQWAEQNKMLYLYHDAVAKGSAGLKYSFTALPSVESIGRMFGELDLKQFKGKKVGILYRQSPNWEPGSTAFAQAVKAGGGQVVAALPVQNNQANYVQDLVQLKSKGAQVVFAWENALATVEMLKQAQALAWHPNWLVFPFNLETNTLGQSAFSQPLWGVATWDAYDPFDHGGPFRPYGAEMAEFEKQYKQYDPSAHLSGDGGDLLYLNWEGQAFISYLLQKCGAECTRNRLAGMLLAGFKIDQPPGCPLDFSTGDHHHGGATMNVFKVIRDPRNRPAWAPVRRCITSFK